MRTTLALICAALFMLILAGGYLLYTGVPGVFAPSKRVQVITDAVFRVERPAVVPGTGFPDSSPGTTMPSVPSFTILTNTGLEMEVLDFRRATSTSGVPVVYAPVREAGTSTAPSGETEPPYMSYLGGEYTLTYFADTQSFVLSLEKEPLAAARKAGELQLLKILGIPEERACFVRHAVLVRGEISEFYGGRNLGFSFCKGAVTL
jgi:hypothetical protein